MKTCFLYCKSIEFMIKCLWGLMTKEQWIFILGRSPQVSGHSQTHHSQANNSFHSVTETKEEPSALEVSNSNFWPPNIHKIASEKEIVGDLKKNRYTIGISLEALVEAMVQQTHSRMETVLNNIDQLLNNSERLRSVSIRTECHKNSFFQTIRLYT